MWGVVLVLLSSNPPEYIACSRCDVIERNTVVGPAGVELEQWIYWEWSWRWYRVVDWQYAQPGQDVVRTTTGWQLTYHDRGDLRRIEAPLYRRTVTPHDPEVADRSNWHLDLRRGIFP